MASIDLNTLLELVGTLNDTAEKGGASERFRNYLRSNIIHSVDAKAYIEAALARSGDQYNKALQDLINHLGQLLGFDVTFGRYRGVRSQVGFDGLWQSPTGWSVIVETKTTDVYTVRTDTLLGYINTLVSERRIQSRDKALGLYVYGRFDRQTNQLENAIAVENRRDQLRVVSVPALLTLLGLKEDYGLSHESILGLLQPAPIRIDPIVDLISGVVAKEQERDTFLTPSEEKATVSEFPHETVFTEKTDHPHVRLVGQGLDYTNKVVTGIVFQDTRYVASKWRDAFEIVLDLLRESDSKRFEESATTLVGRKRPYFSADSSVLRKGALIKGTDLYFETNLSANHMTRVAFELVDRMGYNRTDLIFETADEEP